MSHEIIKVLMERDGYTRTEAETILRDAQQEVRGGADPEELLHNEFGIEPDYIWELI